MIVLVWTVYVQGELFDLMTNDEVEELIGAWAVKRIDSARAVIEFG